jgi:glutaminase
MSDLQTTQRMQQELLVGVVNEVRPFVARGKVATYIPALAKVPLNKLAIASADCSGPEASAGDDGELFSIQSISKVFSLTLALQQGLGPALWKRVGREPSGDPFNSISLLELENGVPRNPFINAGAIVVADTLLSAMRNPLENLLRFISELVGEQISIDSQVAASEESTGFKNKALANFIGSFGNLENRVEDVLDIYFNSDERQTAS